MADQNTVNFYTLTVRSFLTGLRNLSHILTVAEEHATKTKTPPSEYLQARLIADMRPLAYQVQRVSEEAMISAVRVAKQKEQHMVEKDSSFAELQEGIQKTVRYFEEMDEEAYLKGAEEVGDIKYKAGPWDVSQTKLEYILQTALPNFWFHTATAHDILRMKGVPIGKGDFLFGKPAGEVMGKSGDSGNRDVSTLYNVEEYQWSIRALVGARCHLPPGDESRVVHELPSVSGDGRL